MPAWPTWIEITSRMVQIQERRMVAKENPDSCCWRDVCLFLMPISHGARGLIFCQNTRQSPILLTDTGKSQITCNLSEISEGKIENEKKEKAEGNSNIY